VVYLDYIGKYFCCKFDVDSCIVMWQVDLGGVGGVTGSCSASCKGLMDFSSIK